MELDRYPPRPRRDPPAAAAAELQSFALSSCPKATRSTPFSSTGPGRDAVGPPSPLARTRGIKQQPWRRLLHESPRCAPRAPCARSPLPAAPCVSAPRKKRRRRRRRPGPSPRSTRRRPRPSSEAPPEDCSPRRPRRSSTSSPGKGTSRSNMHARTRAPYPGFCLIRTKRTREPLRLGREHLPR